MPRADDTGLPLDDSYLAQLRAPERVDGTGSGRTGSTRTGGGRTGPGRAGTGRATRPAGPGGLRAQADQLLDGPPSILVGAVAAVLAAAVLALTVLAVLTSTVLGGNLGDQAIGVLLWVVAVPVVGLVWYESHGPHRALLTVGSAVVALGTVFGTGLLLSGWSRLAQEMSIAAAGSLAFVTVWSFFSSRSRPARTGADRAETAVPGLRGDRRPA